jgi:hypothetical protein
MKIGDILFILLLLFFIFLFFNSKSCSRIAEQIDEQGLKSIIEEIWEGKHEKHSTNNSKS